MQATHLKLTETLSWLNAPVQYVKGVGPRLAALLKNLNIQTREDLLCHLPARYLDRRHLLPLRGLPESKNCMVLAEVMAAGEGFLGRGRKIFEVIFSDQGALLSARWFHYSKAYFEKRFQKGSKFLLMGELRYYRGQAQMIHPDVQPCAELLEETELNPHLTCVPIYPSTEGLHQKTLRKILQNLVSSVDLKIVETVPQQILTEYQLPSLLQSWQRVHQPLPEDDWQAWEQRSSPFHQRLIFEDFFYLQLGLLLKRKNHQSLLGFAHQSKATLQNKLREQLPFTLTAAQELALKQILADMCCSKPMNRLLQGDVGSGKTLVGLLAAVLAIENGRQVALMAPTEILAEQHCQNFLKLLRPLSIPCVLLTSSVKGAEREQILTQIKSGAPLLVVGTHALLEQEVQFDQLSLVIVDEQHRFGVEQRLKLMQKSTQPDVLVMTATPIPRTLAMTLYGDLDTSIMRELPKNRQPILTRILYEKNRPKLYEFLREKLAQGRQAYFVYPLIEESIKLDLKDAVKNHEKLKEIFNEFEVGLLHGRLTAAEKEAVMAAFASGKIQVLVATTVIEVGIDVPNATVMVVEHAERFGLAQLHQLRGRVGRGEHRSYCILSSAFAASEIARQRLKIMESSTDGFLIAEEDLKIRGPGEILGTRQSGIPELRVADFLLDAKLLQAAREAAQKIIEADPLLKNYPVLRALLQHRWKGRLRLAEVA